MNDRQDVTTDPRNDASQTGRDAVSTTTSDEQRVPVERGDLEPNRTTPVDVQTAQTPQARTQDQTGDIELLPSDKLEDFRGRWQRVQVLFVDQPRDAVQQAHDLVDQVVDSLTQSFGKQREGLMGTWSRGDDVSTEDLRLALQRYRSFFDRLLST